MAIESDDGLVFDLDALTATAIREEMEYGGTRLKTSAYLEKTRIPVTIDIGFGDAMADATQTLDYPTLLDLPAPNVRAYPPASVIAEKFQAMVALGVLNGRMKDYYDLWAIPRALDIAADDLDAAPRRSSAARRRSRRKGRPGFPPRWSMMRSSSANGAPTRPPLNSGTFPWNRSSTRFGNWSDRRARGFWQRQRRHDFRQRWGAGYRKHQCTADKSTGWV
jgi:hypothetical protein